MDQWTVDQWWPGQLRMRLDHHNIQIWIPIGIYQISKPVTIWKPYVDRKHMDPRPSEYMTMPSANQIGCWSTLRSKNADQQPLIEHEALCHRANCQIQGQQQWGDRQLHQQTWGQDGHSQCWWQKSLRRGAVSWSVLCVSHDMQQCVWHLHEGS